ncbi:MAG: hypothetical protein WBA22_10550 [Candidatus Methanofastidiosia archaeon]
MNEGKKADLIPVEFEMEIRLIAVIVLGLVVLLSVIGAIVLAITGNPVPELLGALGYTALDALAELLTSLSKIGSRF